MTNPEIPDEAKRLATDAVRNRMLESGDFATAAEEAIAAALPHLRAQETPAPGELHKALEKALDDELCTCEQCEDGDKYNDGVRSVIKAVQAVLSTHPAPQPRPLVDREALVTEIVARFHVLHPRIPDLDKGDCHCELLAQLAADAVLALPPTACTCPTDAKVTPDMRTETGQHLTGCPAGLP